MPDDEDDFNFAERFTSLKAELEKQITEEDELNKRITTNLSKIDKINELLPANIRGELPSIEELEAEIDREYEELKAPAQKSFDTNIQLNYRIDTYWYGFILVNYNNQQPFVKKLYHEQLSKKDIEFITDTIYNSVMENIEWQIERLKSKNK